MNNTTVRGIRLCMVGAIALFFSLVAFDNAIEFKSNFIALQHVLSMDTTSSAPMLMQRAITSPVIQRGAYYLIIVWQAVTAIVCWMGCLQLLRQIRASDAQFNRAKTLAFIGLFMGFLLYMVGFVVIAGEWFSMWQSPVWNAQPKAGLFTGLIMMVMIFLALP